jgi:hypothetical protein
MKWEKTEPDSNWIVGNEETSQPSTAFPKRSAEMGSCRKIAIAQVDRQSIRAIAFYEKVIKVKADVAAFLINCFPSA